jgi:hypothetical protein
VPARQRGYFVSPHRTPRIQHLEDAEHMGVGIFESTTGRSKG